MHEIIEIPWSGAFHLGDFRKVMDFQFQTVSYLCLPVRGSKIGSFSQGVSLSALDALKNQEEHGDCKLRPQFKRISPQQKNSSPLNLQIESAPQQEIVNTVVPPPQFNSILPSRKNHSPLKVKSPINTKIPQKKQPKSVTFLLCELIFSTQSHKNPNQPTEIWKIWFTDGIKILILKTTIFRCSINLNATCFCSLQL